MNRFLTKILVLFSLIFLSLTLSGQEYVPLDLSDGATWSQTECGYKPPWGAIYKLKIFGDTTINHKLYKKIYYQYRRSAGICSNCNFNFNRDSASLFAFIRQDIANRKVFFVHPYMADKEWLLYNFNITDVGQSIPGFSLIFTTNPESTPVAIYVYQLIVDGIDSLCVNGSYVKRYYFGAGNGGNIYHQPEFWVEGIGSTHGLLVSGYGGPDWAHTLYCFHNQDYGIYYDTSAVQSCVLRSSVSCVEGMDCSPITSVFPGEEGSILTLYPNPVHDKVYIRTSLPAQTVTFSFFNRMGQKVLSKKINIHPNMEPVSVSELSPGFYFVTIEGKRWFTGQKLIKE